MGYVRNDVDFSLKSSNNILEIDAVNNVKAIKEGSASFEASYEGIIEKLTFKFLKILLKKLF